mgnify:CR=1 FL=1
MVKSAEKDYTKALKEYIEFFIESKKLDEYGNKSFEKNYKDGKLNGQLIRFHENGQIRTEWIFNNHKVKDGIFYRDFI